MAIKVGDWVRVVAGPEEGQKELVVGRVWRVSAVEPSGLTLQYLGTTACGVSPRHVAKCSRRRAA